jgi:CBS domain-containing protein
MKYTTAKDLMNADVKTVEADWPINRVAEFLISHDISGAPVTDEDGLLIGVVSLTDIAEHSGSAGGSTTERPPAYYQTEDLGQYAPEDLDALQIKEGDTLTARDVMTPEIYDVSKHTSVQQVAEVMLRGRIHRVFVTQGDEVLGIVTALDMLRVIKDI